MTPLEPAGRPAAFFDLDHTLLTVNSGRLWLDHERRNGRIGKRQMLLGLWYLGLYRFGWVDIEHVMGSALATVKGESEADLRTQTHRWFDADVAQHAAPGAQAFLAAHRRAGHPVVLLTSSSPYASERAVALFELDGYLSTQFEVADGAFTGGFISPICYGEGKITWAERWARERGISLDQSYFYTDSNTDEPMLARVGNPRVVHPDPRLKRTARKRRWPVLDWHAGATDASTAAMLEHLRSLPATPPPPIG